MKRNFCTSISEPIKHIGLVYQTESFLNKDTGGISDDLSLVKSEVDQSVTADDYSLDRALVSGLLLKPCPQVSKNRLENADTLSDNVAMFNAAKSDIETEKLNNN